MRLSLDCLAEYVMSSGLVFVVIMGLLKGPVMDVDQTHFANLGPKQVVLASWYGQEFNGRPMANGEPFDEGDPTTVAHKTLPLGTRLVLHNPINGETIDAEVKDRGPFKPGRSYDVSKAAAEKLGFIDEGLAKLEVRVVKTD